MMKKMLGSLVLVCMFGVTSSDAITMWQVRCFGELGEGVPIRAFTENGLSYRVQEIKAMLPAKNYLAIKAFNETTISVPLTVVKADERINNVKVFTKNRQLKQTDFSSSTKGVFLTIQGVDDKGGVYVIKAFPTSKGDYVLKCVSVNGKELTLKAISPSGELYDIKGFKSIKSNTGLKELQVDVKNNASFKN